MPAATSPVPAYIKSLLRKIADEPDLKPEPDLEPERRRQQAAIIEWQRQHERAAS